jgi:hypothetical protein
MKIKLTISSTGNTIRASIENRFWIKTKREANAIGKKRNTLNNNPAEAK